MDGFTEHYFALTEQRRTSCKSLCKDASLGNTWKRHSLPIRSASVLDSGNAPHSVAPPCRCSSTPAVSHASDIGNSASATLDSKHHVGGASIEHCTDKSLHCTIRAADRDGETVSGDARAHFSFEPLVLAEDDEDETSQNSGIQSHQGASADVDQGASDGVDDAEVHSAPSRRTLREQAEALLAKLRSQKRLTCSSDSSAIDAEMDEKSSEESLPDGLPTLNTNNHSLNLQLSSTARRVKYTGLGFSDNDIGIIQSTLPIRLRRYVCYFEVKLCRAEFDSATHARRNRFNARATMNVQNDIEIGYAPYMRNLHTPPYNMANFLRIAASTGKLYGLMTTSSISVCTGATAGDIIGCGIMHHPRHGVQLFFTKNGTYCSSAFRFNVDIFSSNYFPTLAIHSHMDEVDVNFGQKPFAFDIDIYRRQLEQKWWDSEANAIEAAEEDAKTGKPQSKTPKGLAKFQAIFPSFSKALVQSYLRESGYHRTAATLEKETAFVDTARHPGDCGYLCSKGGDVDDSEWQRLRTQLRECLEHRREDIESVIPAIERIIHRTCGGRCMYRGKQQSRLQSHRCWKTSKLRLLLLCEAFISYIERGLVLQAVQWSQTHLREFVEWAIALEKERERSCQESETTTELIGQRGFRRPMQSWEKQNSLLSVAAAGSQHTDRDSYLRSLLNFRRRGVNPVAAEEPESESDSSGWDDDDVFDSDVSNEDAVAENDEDEDEDSESDSSGSSSSDDDDSADSDDDSQPLNFSDSDSEAVLSPANEAQSFQQLVIPPVSDPQPASASADPTEEVLVRLLGAYARPGIQRWSTGTPWAEGLVDIAARTNVSTAREALSEALQQIESSPTSSPRLSWTPESRLALMTSTLAQNSRSEGDGAASEAKSPSTARSNPATGRRSRSGSTSSRRSRSSSRSRSRSRSGSRGSKPRRSRSGSASKRGRSGSFRVASAESLVAFYEWDRVLQQMSVPSNAQAQLPVRFAGWSAAMQRDESRQLTALARYVLDTTSLVAYGSTPGADTPLSHLFSAEHRRRIAASVDELLATYTLGREWTSLELLVRSFLTTTQSISGDPDYDFVARGRERAKRRSQMQSTQTAASDEECLDADELE